MLFDYYIFTVSQLIFVASVLFIYLEHQKIEIYLSYSQQLLTGREMMLIASH